MLPTIFATLSIFCVSVLTSAPDPGIRDPRRIWHLETDAPGNELDPALAVHGLRGSRPGTEQSRVNRIAKGLVVERVLERVNEIYRRRPDGARVPGWSIDITFVAADPDPGRYPGGPGVGYSRICIGGRHRTCGGVLGTQYLDPGNSSIEWQCSPGRLGVFAGRICGLDSQLSPALAAADLRFVDGSYGLGDDDEASDARFLAVRSAIEDWGTAVGNVTAHEIGHALGLEHDRRRGHVMEARISTEDLSNRGLAMSPTSLRVLTDDVGIARSRAAIGPATEYACALDLDTSLGSHAARATAIALVGTDGAVGEAVRGGVTGWMAEEAALVARRERAGGVVIWFEDGATAYVPAETPAEASAIADRLRTLVPGDRDSASVGLTHWSRRIAGDAAIELDAAAGVPGPAEAACVEDALTRNRESFDDLRPLIRLAGRAGCAGAVGAILDVVTSSDEIDLVPAAARALALLRGRSAVAGRLALLSAGPARSRLARLLVSLPDTSASEREVYLEDADPGVSLAAALALLDGGAESRARLAGAARRIGGERGAMLDGLRRRPRRR